MSLEPKCIHFKICGGCATQDIPYDKQLEVKELFIKEQFVGHAVLPIIPSPELWQYRNKMEFSFSQSKEKEHFLGLMMRKGRGKVVNLTECHLTQNWYSQTLSNVRAWWKKSDLEAYYPPQNRGHLRTLTLRTGLKTGEKMALLTIAEDLSEEHLSSFTAAILESGNCDAIILRKQIVAKKCPTRFEERVLFGKDHINEKMVIGNKRRELYFKIRPSSFFQPNTWSAEIVYNRAITLSELNPTEWVLDLYCGTGAIGCAASFEVEKVVGIELNCDAVFDAQENIVRNSISNMEVMASDVADADLGKATTVIVDPPRVGLSSQVIKKICQLRPKKIVYISCNPITQGQNIKEFENAGYKIKVIQPIDQFPHTPHVENIVVLEG
jgi:23S rRNA (uracil1939-C5)-methyltransferase